MAITLITDMLYTRQGEGEESNVLSAHDPLIWVFNDNNIGSNPTATIQFVVTNNLQVTIYTSDIFPCYVLSFAGTTAVFRFDATQIIKHIINNYFYKETSEIIKAENYGSGIEVTIKTYDDTILEDTEVVDYFASQAVNQIGDEYGTNIPRLFYNDTEEIAHFLGFPNHLFFYSPTNLVLEDSVIDFMTRDKEAAVKFLHSTDDDGHPTFSIVTDRTSPTLWYYNNKTYGVYMKQEGTPDDCNSMIFAYDHLTGIISANYLCVVGFANGQDDHASPIVIVADDGRILVAREKLSSISPTNGHNSAVYIMRSDNVEDETSWVNALAHNANFFSEIGTDVGATRLAYSHFAKLETSELFLWARSGSDQEIIRIFESIDNGISWDGFGTGEANGLIVYVGQGGVNNHYAYESQLRTGVHDKLHMVIYPFDNTPSELNFMAVYYLWSYDGITWRNVDNSWTKNISVAGAVTEAEAETNMKVCGGAAPLSFVFRSGCLDHLGNPHILITSYQNFDLTHYWWDGVAWQSEKPTDKFTDYQYGGTHPILTHRSGTTCLDLVVPRDTGGDLFYSFYECSDFSTWTFVNSIDADDNFRYAQFTFNYPDAAYLLWAFLNISDAAYSDIYVCAEAAIFEEYGVFGLYVHDLNLSRFVLNKDIYQCNVYFDPAAPELIKTYNLTIFEPCENAVYIRFLTKDGYYMYWAFSQYPKTVKSGDKIGDVINNFSEMALAQSSNFSLGYRNSFNKIDIIASAVPIVFRRKLLDLFTSPAIYMWKGSLGEYEDEADWILLDKVEGSHILREKMEHDNFECALVLPENYTQTLSGQNL